MGLVTVNGEQHHMSLLSRGGGDYVVVATLLARARSFTQHLAPITVDNYVVVNGMPTPDTGLGIASTATCYIDNSGITCGQLLPPGSPHTDVVPPPVPAANGTPTTPPTTTVYTQPQGTPPAPPGVPANKVVLPPGTGKPGVQQGNATVPPKASNPGSDYRFLPLTGDFSGSVWSAHGGTKLYPKLQLVTQAGYSNDPVRDDSYYYIQHNPTEHINAPALQLNGHGYLQVVTGGAANALRAHASMLMCFVPNHGTGSYYPIYSSKRQAANNNLKRVEFRYVKGHIWLYIGNRLFKKIPLSLQHGEPCLFGWAWNGSTAAIYVWDRNRYQFSMNTKGTYYWDLNGDIGAGPQTAGSPTIDWTNAADMDILEINMWETGLSDAQMHTALAHLSHVYGVGRT